MVDRSLILPNEKGVMLAVSHCRGKNDRMAYVVTGYYLSLLHQYTLVNDSHVDDSW